MKKQESKKQSTPFSEYKDGDPLVLLIQPATEEELIQNGDKQEFKMKTLPHISSEEEVSKMFGEIAATLLPKGFEIYNFGSPLDMYQSLAKRLKIPKDPSNIIDITKENISLANQLKIQKREISDLRIQVASLEIKIKEAKA